jgi:hypothetical protein
MQHFPLPQSIKYQLLHHILGWQHRNKTRFRCMAFHTVDESNATSTSRSVAVVQSGQFRSLLLPLVFRPIPIEHLCMARGCYTSSTPLAGGCQSTAPSPNHFYLCCMLPSLLAGCQPPLAVLHACLSRQFRVPSVSLLHVADIGLLF